MPVEDFHKSRRMFCIHKGEVLVGSSGSPLSHHKWFNSLGLDVEKMINESVRGFVDDRGLFFYKGDDFNVDGETERAFLKHLTEIQGKLNLPDETPVYGGVIKTNDFRYPPKKKYGTIAQLTGENTE
jgi:hypothetical protein